MLMRLIVRTIIAASRTWSPIFGKIFDHIILERYRDKLMSCEQQFGFKAQSTFDKFLYNDSEINYI